MTKPLPNSQETIEKLQAFKLALKSLNKAAELIDFASYEANQIPKTLKPSSFTSSKSQEEIIEIADKVLAKFDIEEINLIAEKLQKMFSNDNIFGYDSLCNLRSGLEKDKW